MVVIPALVGLRAAAVEAVLRVYMEQAGQAVTLLVGGLGVEPVVEPMLQAALLVEMAVLTLQQAAMAPRELGVVVLTLLEMPELAVEAVVPTLEVLLSVVLVQNGILPTLRAVETAVEETLPSALDTAPLVDSTAEAEAEAGGETFRTVPTERRAS